MGRIKGKHDPYIHQCFTGKLGYVYTADRRKSGGYWLSLFQTGQGLPKPPTHFSEALAGYTA